MRKNNYLYDIWANSIFVNSIIILQVVHSFLLLAENEATGKYEYESSSDFHHSSTGEAELARRIHRILILQNVQSIRIK